MSKWYECADYSVTRTGVRFACADEGLTRVFTRAEALCRENVRFFGDRKVLQEGAKYHGVWLETQPMGGETYASRDMEIALNNHLIFLQYQRRDGRMPGMISYDLPWKGVMVHQDWMQGDFFTPSALRMGYLLQKDARYLRLLYDALKDFDNYLWAYRDSDGDGCLESWCVWDTGEDNNTRLLFHRVHAVEHGLAGGEHPPKDHGDMPFASAEYMAYSYSHRTALAELSDLLGLGEGDFWRAEARAVRDRAVELLWDDERKAIFDRDRFGRRVDTLTLENLKCMYHGLFTQEMADAFIERHLMNRAEFFTPLPLPNLAANDPLFYVNEQTNNLSPEARAVISEYVAGDMEDNSWAGPVEGLSVQRSVDALLNYGHAAEAGLIGRKWLANLAKQDRFVQQYHPFTGEPSPGEDGYGPTCLAALEYVARLWGVRFVKDRLYWAAGRGADCEYGQTLFGRDYLLRQRGDTAEASLDGKPLFSVSRGALVVTDPDGRVLSLTNAEAEPLRLTLRGADGVFSAEAAPNEKLEPRGGALERVGRVPFFAPGE